jgi:hypothetical protein
VIPPTFLTDRARVISPDSVEAAVECTHCRVVMTSWSVAGSPIRYYQCPFCARTHSSYYGEVFQHRAGARVLEGPARETRPDELPKARPEDVRWAAVKAQAARWFARLDADQQRLADERPATPPRIVPVASDDDVVAAGTAPKRPGLRAATPVPVRARTRR